MRRLPCGLLLLLLVPGPATACSLCGYYSKRDTLSTEWGRADVVVYGTLAKPRLDGARPGSGSTELHVSRVAKASAAWQPTPVVTLPQYLPILDPKNPPHALACFRREGDKLTLIFGRVIASPAVLDYLQGLHAFTTDGPKRLSYAGRHLDHADPTVAEEAFLELARASDRDIGTLARTLDPARLRKVLAQPNLEPEQVSLFAYLLGACGEAGDAELLRGLLKGQHSFKALEGVLAGTMTLCPDEGWKLCHKLLGDAKEGFVVRIGAVRALRFFHNSRPAESRDQVLHGLALMIPHGDLADFAVSDLCAWKVWDHTALVLAQYDKPSHQAPIARRSILRYALLCPLPEARRFVERVRREDPATLRELEEDLRSGARADDFTLP